MAMREFDFTVDELARFHAHFETASEWVRWERASGLSGRDMISVYYGSTESTPIRLAKGEGGYMATGFGDWGLIVCESFDELLSAIAPESRKVA